MQENFSGDYRVMRVVMSSDNPIETLHKIRTNQYSIHTFMDMLEMLDVKSILEDYEYEKNRIEINKKKE